MKALFPVLAALAVMALAFWAYRENYATKAALDDVTRLEREIGHQREALAVLRAEWAYLNRPDRLRDLVDLNFDRLGLLTFRPGQFGSVELVTYPEPESLMPMVEPIDVIGREEALP